MSTQAHNVSARFDDLQTGANSFALQGLEGVLQTQEASEVVEVLDRAEEAARAGCWVAGFLAYEAAPGLDAALSVRDEEATDMPLAWFGVFRERIAVSPLNDGIKNSYDWVLQLTERDHSLAVAQVKHHIAQGNSYQVNLTLRAEATVADPFELYSAMTQSQLGAYSAYISTGVHAVLCASPELLFERADTTIRTRPMKGTRRRGRWLEEDLQMKEELRSSEKERAEHVMIVDLLRNDLGRICDIGSVRVEEFERLERYPTVWQMVSTISGTQSRPSRLSDIFRALFPCGSVTGAPKRRTMEIIAELEAKRRGVYCGAIGYISPTIRHARFAVGIRTACTQLSTGDTVFGSGGGITWDSDPSGEWDEVLAKCSVLAANPVKPELLETFRFNYGSGTVNLGLHLERMSSSARYFGIEFDSTKARDLVEENCSRATRSKRIRLLLDNSGHIRVEMSELPRPTSLPVRLGYADRSVDSGDVELFHKLSNRDRFDAARRSRPDVDDVVLLNERGEVTQTTIANIAVQLAGDWWTPPVSCGLLPGVERTRLLSLGAMDEQVIMPEVLADADGLMVLNSLRGASPAVLVDR